MILRSPNAPHRIFGVWCDAMVCELRYGNHRVCRWFEKNRDMPGTCPKMHDLRRSWGCGQRYKHLNTRVSHNWWSEMKNDRFKTSHPVEKIEKVKPKKKSMKQKQREVWSQSKERCRRRRESRLGERLGLVGVWRGREIEIEERGREVLFIVEGRLEEGGPVKWNLVEFALLFASYQYNPSRGAVGEEICIMNQGLSSNSEQRRVWHDRRWETPTYKHNADDCLFRKCGQIWKGKP